MLFFCNIKWTPARIKKTATRFSMIHVAALLFYFIYQRNTSSAIHHWYPP